MKRPTWNYLVDWSAFLLITSLLATGLLLSFRLPPGSGGASVLSLTRHQWGDVHFWIAMGLCTLVVIHLLLHWKWIKSLTVGKAMGTQHLMRAWGAIAAACLIIGAVVALLFWPVHELPNGQGKGQNHGASQMDSPRDGHPGNRRDSESRQVRQSQETLNNNSMRRL